MLEPKSQAVRLTSANDLNDIITIGHYCVLDANTPANCPSWGGLNSYIIVRKLGPAERFIQVLFELNTKECGWRAADGYSGTWTSWYKFTTT